MIRQMNPANEMRRNLEEDNEKTKSSMGRHTGIIQPTHLAQTVETRGIKSILKDKEIVSSGSKNQKPTSKPRVGNDKHLQL